MDSVKWRGWSDKGSSEWSRQFAPRQGCQWTDKEDYDLMQQIEYGVPIPWIADFHQRSAGGITCRLLYPERAQAGAARYVAGIPKPGVEKHVAHKRGRYLKNKHYGAKRYQRMIEQERHHGSR